MLLTAGISIANMESMTEITLKKFLEGRTQSEVAAVLGVNQSAISQMLASGRDIRFRLDDSGKVLESFEVKALAVKVA